MYYAHHIPTPITIDDSLPTMGRKRRYSEPVCY